MLDALPRNETFDWVDKVSIELTTMMLATLFDFPWEDRRKLTYWSDVAIANVDAPDDAVVHSKEERFAELMRMADYFKARCGTSAPAQPPKFDLISMMAHGEAHARHAGRASSSAISALLIVGGNDTTRNSMSGGLLALSKNPGELAKLKANPRPGAEPGRRRPSATRRRSSTCAAPRRATPSLPASRSARATRS